jgi:hypothetical protein
MTREEALALLKLAKRQMRDGCGPPPVDSARTARRFVRVVSDDRDSELEAWGEAGRPMK